MVLSQRKGVAHRKRKLDAVEHDSATATMLSNLAELQELRAFKEAVLSPLVGGLTFDLNCAEEKVELARQLWRGGYAESLSAMRDANPAYVKVIEAQVANSGDGKASEKHVARKRRLVDGILMCTSRAQSKMNMPLVTAALTVLSNADNVPVDFHEAVRQFFNGALATPNWCTSLMEEACKVRPPPDEETVDQVRVAVFDNLSMKKQYGAYMLGGEGGELKHMTNWFHVSLPKAPRPPNILCASDLHGRDVSQRPFAHALLPPLLSQQPGCSREQERAVGPFLGCDSKWGAPRAACCEAYVETAQGIRAASL